MLSSLITTIHHLSCPTHATRCQPPSLSIELLRLCPWPRASSLIRRHHVVAQMPAISKSLPDEDKQLAYRAVESLSAILSLDMIDKGTKAPV